MSAQARTPHGLVVPWPAQREAALRRLERAHAAIVASQADVYAVERELWALATQAPQERVGADEPEYLPLRQAATRFGLGRDRLRALVATGEVAASRSGRKVLVSIPSLRDYLAGEAL